MGNNQLFRERPSDLLIPQHATHQVPEPAHILPSMISCSPISTLADIVQYHSQMLEPEKSQYQSHQSYVQFNKLSSMISRAPISTLEDMVQYQSQMLESEKSQHQSHQSYVQFNEPSSMISRAPISTLEDIVQSCSQMFGSEKTQHQTHQSYVQFNKPSKAQSEKLDGVQHLASGISVLSRSQSKRTANGLLRVYNYGDPYGPTAGNYVDMLPPSKHQKMENSLRTSPNENETYHPLAPLLFQPSTPEGLVNLQRQLESPLSINSGVPMVIMEDDVNANSSKLGSRSVHVLPKALSFDRKEEEVQVRTEINQTEPEIESKSIAPETICEKAVQSGNTKIRGASLTDFFTAEQINEHILSLRQWVGKVSTSYYCFG